jgi:WD40 repeat protein
MMVLDEETAGWQGDGVSVGFDASAEYRHVDQLKEKLEQLREKLAQLAARAEALREAEEKMASEREGVEAEMAAVESELEAEVAAVESELEAAVAAPASGGRDPTTWLPDELLIAVLLLVPFASLWTGRCARVCRRWRAVVESAPVKRRKRKGRWEAYAKGWIEPRKLKGHTDYVCTLASGIDGTIFSGSRDHTVRVWNGADSTHIRTLEGPTSTVLSIAVGRDGTVYAAFDDDTIWVWSGEDGTHIRILFRHELEVSFDEFFFLEDAFAVGPNGKLYTASLHRGVLVRSTRDGALIQTLEGHTGDVIGLRVGLDGRVYSASRDRTIRVWSGDDGAHLQTLAGHTDSVTAMAWGPDGKLYSGSKDLTIRVWSDDGSTIFKTTESAIYSLAWSDGNVFAAMHKSISVWSSDQLGPTDPPLHVLTRYRARRLISESNGDLYFAAGNAILKM